jgi:PEP-CTERM motif
MNGFRIVGGVAVTLALTPVMARAAEQITYSDLLPQASYSIMGSETDYASFSVTTNRTKNQPSLPLAETTGGVSANADLLFTHNDPIISYPDPQVSVSMTTALSEGESVARFGAVAEVDIFFEVDRATLSPSEQPDTIQVQIDGTFFGGSSRFAGAAVDVYEYGDGNPILSTDAGTNGEGGFSLSLDATPLTVYEVRYQASASACLASNPIETCANTTPGTYVAGIDPVVMVDPALTADGDYTLTMSAGLAPTTPVPEPATWTMAMIGFAAIGWLATRRSVPAAGPMAEFGRSPLLTKMRLYQ